MKRAIIIASGKVQKVGYRDFVQDSARELGITGYVENLEDGNVKIVCEDEEAKIEEFIRDIKVKKDFIYVSETSVKYEAPTGDFVQDKIKYGDVPEELGDRLGAALLCLGATNQKIDAGFKMLGEKQDQMLNKQDETIGAIGEVSERIDRGKEDIVTEIRNVSEKIDHGKEDIVTEVRNVSEKIDHGKEDIVTEVKALREDLRSYMENKFARIEYEIEGIKAKIGMV